MSRDDFRGIEYVREVYEDSQRFAISLLRQNERLRKQNAELQHEISVRTAVLNARSSKGGSANAGALEERLQEVEEANRRLEAEQLALQQQSASLLNLYVAAYRLCGTLDRKEVLQTLQEIIANMVGSEEIGIFELDPERGELELIDSVGIDANRFACVGLDHGAIGQAVRTGEIYLGGRATGEDGNVTACVPMAVSGRVVGVIAIFGLLGQKPGLDSDDLELFNLLRTHAGMALYCSRLFAEHGAP